MDSHLYSFKEDSSNAVFIEQEISSMTVCTTNSTANTVRGMNKATRRDLTDEERAECARLKAVYEKRKAEARDRGEKLTQSDVGDACGWKSGQSAVNQYFNGKVPLNVEAILKLSEILGFKPAEVSPRLAAEIARIAQAAPGAAQEPASPEQADKAPAGRAIVGRTLFEKITPRSRALVDRILEMEAHGALTDEDLKVLTEIVERFGSPK